MYLLLGSTRSPSFLRQMRALGWGRLFAAETPKPAIGEPWALDNGVFAAWKAGEPWTDTRFLAACFATERRIRVGKLHPPLFAVLPDRVADPASLATSLSWHERVGRMIDGIPWYLAVQNGMRPADVRRALIEHELAGVFLGGDDDFKKTARSWCELAHAEGRGFHFARVSTPARLREAVRIGADSADTTQPLWSEQAFQRFADVWRELAEPTQLRMFNPRDRVLPGQLGLFGAARAPATPAQDFRLERGDPPRIIDCARSARDDQADDAELPAHYKKTAEGFKAGERVQLGARVGVARWFVNVKGRWRALVGWPDDKTEQYVDLAKLRLAPRELAPGSEAYWIVLRRKKGSKRATLDGYARVRIERELAGGTTYDVRVLRSSQAGGLGTEAPAEGHRYEAVPRADLYAADVPSEARDFAEHVKRYQAAGHE